MNEPSSRTPEGIPHRCATCGTTFRICTSLAGDACCPNCNTLVWPVGSEGLDDPQGIAQKSRTRTKEIRLRPRTIESEFDQQSKRAAVFLRNQQYVRVTVLFKGRGPEAKSEGQALLDRFVGCLVPEHATIKTPAGIEGRRIFCTLAPGPSSQEPPNRNHA